MRGELKRVRWDGSEGGGGFICRGAEKKTDKDRVGELGASRRSRRRGWEGTEKWARAWEERKAPLRVGLDVRAVWGFLSGKGSRLDCDCLAGSVGPKSSGRTRRGGAGSERTIETGNGHRRAPRQPSASCRRVCGGRRIIAGELRLRPWETGGSALSLSRFCFEAKIFICARTHIRNLFVFFGIFSIFYRIFPHKCALINYYNMFCHPRENLFIFDKSVNICSQFFYQLDI